MTKISFALAGILSASLVVPATFAADFMVHTWKKIQINDLFWSEGANIGDFNHDGKMDVVSGPYWWAGPTFHVRHEYYPATKKFALGPVSKIPVSGFEGALGHNNTYSDNFFAFTADFNKDGWDDILIYGFPGKDASWFENPGKGKPMSKTASPMLWVTNVVFVTNQVVAENRPIRVLRPRWEKGATGLLPEPWRSGHALSTGGQREDVSKVLMVTPAPPVSAPAEQPWKRHKVLDVVDNESPTWGDITGDGKPEIICSSKGSYGYASPDWNDAAKPWTFRTLSPNNKYHMFTHGLGYGDVSGDGKLDLMEKSGWWEQPASLDGDPQWKFHAFPFAPTEGSSQMYAYDVNGDGLPDVVTALAAHNYGLAWYEQLKEKNSNGEPTWKQHLIMGKTPRENKYGLVFSQLHAVDFVDMDGDGLKDIVTGKRFWAHGAHGDADPTAPAVVYWFKLVRNADGSVDWLPYLIDNDSGVGTQVVAADANGDGLPDVIVGNKKGTFVHLHGVKTVSEEEWKKAQPKAVVQQTVAK